MEVTVHVAQIGIRFAFRMDILNDKVVTEFLDAEEEQVSRLAVSCTCRHVFGFTHLFTSATLRIEGAE